MRIGFIGTGAMGGALLERIHGKPGELSFTLFDKDAEKLQKMARQFGAEAMLDEGAVVQASDIVFLAVKPAHMQTVLDACAMVPHEEKVFVTLAVGIPLASYQATLGKEAKVIRTMPNTPALVGEGMTLWCATPAVLEKESDQVVTLLQAAGLVEQLEERLMNEVTALTGSSPAYFFMMIEAMGDAAVRTGIPRASAYRWAAAAMAGSAKMVLETGRHPGELKDMVTSPAGTTIEGVAALEEAGFRHAILAGMEAVTRRANEIGRAAAASPVNKKVES